MIDPNSLLADEATSLATACVVKTFLHSGDGGGPDVGPPESSRQLPSLECLQHPLRLLPVYEGLLIEGACGLALQHDPNFHVIGKKVVVVTDTDRALVERNVHADLGGIEPPTGGQPIGEAEIDCIAVDRRTGVLLLCDVKRSYSSGDGAVVAPSIACLAARRAVRSEGLQFAAVQFWRVRWFHQRPNMKAGFINRGTVDAALGAKVQEVVDHAVDALRRTFYERLAALLEARKSVPDATPSAVQKYPVSEPPLRDFDLAALERAFGRSARPGRDA